MNLNEILEDPGISYWLKDAIKTAYERDPVDALHDARRLLKMLGVRYTQIVNRADPLFASFETGSFLSIEGGGQGLQEYRSRRTG
jgi:hypothetical protein